jgi:hypothetical protein
MPRRRKLPTKYLASGVTRQAAGRRRAVRIDGRSVLEHRFLGLWTVCAPKGSPPPVEEHCFAAGSFAPNGSDEPTSKARGTTGPTRRRWRFDFAWPEQLVAVELEGGIWTGGAHTRGKHYQSDCEKYNAAALRGWRVLRYTTDDLTKRPVQVIEEVVQALTYGGGREAG